MDQPERHALGLQGLGQADRHADGAVLAAGAAQGDDQGLFEGAVVGLVKGDPPPEHVQAAFKEGPGLRGGEDVVAHVFVKPRFVLQGVNPIWIRESSDPYDGIGVLGQAEEVAEGHQRYLIHFVLLRAGRTDAQWTIDSGQWTV